MDQNADGMLWTDVNERRMRTGMACGLCGTEKQLTGDQGPGQGLIEVQNEQRVCRQIALSSKW